MRPALRTALLLFLLALLARAGLAAVTGISGPPVEDERGYVLVARSLAAGEGFSLPLPPDLGDVPPRVAFRAPLWPVVLAPLVALSEGLAAGTTAEASTVVTLCRLAAVLVGALTAPLAWLAFRRAGAGDRGALIVAIAFALWPTELYVSVRAFSEPLATALLLAAIAVPSGSRRRDAFAGALLGLSVLARPAALLPALGIALVRACGEDAARRRVAAAAVAVASLLVVLAPWVVRNALLLGRPLLTTNSGVTLVGANARAALEADPPGKWQPPEVVYAGRPDAPDLGMWGWRSLGEEASDRRFTGDALAFLRDEPAAALRQIGAKLVRFADPDQHSAKGDAKAKRIVGWLTWAPLLALAACGTGSLFRDRRRAPFAALLLGVLGTTVVFYGDARMRAAATPALLVAALAGADRLRSLVRGVPRG